jgi:hypothetical protein
MNQGAVNLAPEEILDLISRGRRGDDLGIRNGIKKPESQSGGGVGL